LRANSTNNKIVIRHAGYFIAGVGSVCHPSLIQVNGLGVTERLQMERYAAICADCGTYVVNRQTNHKLYGECEKEQAKNKLKA
jgi:hypothetical protein